MVCRQWGYVTWCSISSYSGTIGVKRNDKCIPANWHFEVQFLSARLLCLLRRLSLGRTAVANLEVNFSDAIRSLRSQHSFRIRSFYPFTFLIHNCFLSAWVWWGYRRRWCGPVAYFSFTLGRVVASKQNVGATYQKKLLIPFSSVEDFKERVTMSRPKQLCRAELSGSGPPSALHRNC